MKDEPEMAESQWIGQLNAPRDRQFYAPILCDGLPEGIAPEDSLPKE